MIDNTRVVVFFKLFSDLPDAECNRWKELCDNSARQLEAMLKKDLGLTAEGERLAIAAAAFAYADYLLIGKKGSANSEQIKIGDISLRSSSASAAAKQDSQGIREYFIKQIEDLLQPAAMLRAVEQ